MTVNLADIRAAAAAIEGTIAATPCVAAARLSEICGAEVVLKLENRQATGSFKERGALYRLLAVAESGTRGVVAASAGNHAQAVAYHARRLGLSATVVMPRDTPFVKVERTRAFGAEVVLAGADVNEAMAVAEREGARQGLAFVHPYDDERIIAGQGTVGLEMLSAAPDLACIVVPVGGGGLCAGIAVAAKALKPEIAVIGVQTALYATMVRSDAGAPAPGGPTVADGIAVKSPGRLTRPLIDALVDDVLAVEEGEIERAILLMLEEDKTVAEGAGAAPLAALLAAPERFRGRRVGLVVSGGNIDPRILSSVILRGLVREGRLARLRIAIVDRPGALARVAGSIGEAGANIIEVYHERAFTALPLKSADILVVLETRDQAHLEQVVAGLRRIGHRVEVLGHDQPAAPRAVP